MRIVVVGAGVGGMAAALRLAKAGHAVTVLEQGERIGGKLGVWEPDVPGIGRFRFDTGPHVLTMPWVIEDLFRDLGFVLRDHLDLVRIDPICRYHFPGDAFFDAAADIDEAARRIGERFPGEETGFRDLLAYARRVYDTTVEPFLCQDFAASVRGIPSPAQWRQLARFLALAPWQTLDQRIARHVRHPLLRQIFDLYAFYNGSSPFQASAIFAIIAWVQWGQGTFYLRGGLRTYGEALEKLANALGVEIRLGTTAEGIRIEGNRGRGRVTGAEIAGGGCVPADVVICNADPLTAYRDLVPPEQRPAAFGDEAALARLEPSTSAFVLLLGARGDWPHLAHYNSFLPADPNAESAAIFGRGLPADDPVIGVTCQSVTDPDCAPPGHSNLFVMTSPPALSERFSWTNENTARYRDRVIDLLETRCGMDGLRERIVCEQIWTPETFAARYGAFRGSLYGLSSNSWRAAFLRPPNRARGVRGLFFVGGGTHPGGGLPLVTLGGKIVAEEVDGQTKFSPASPRESRAPSNDGH